MNEKRNSRRLDLEVSIELERLDQGALTTVKMLNVDVLDMSGTGMGFRSTQPLEQGTLYNTKIQIWTKEVLDAVIRIVYCKENGENDYRCGATFVGLVESDALKINIYQMLNPEQKED